MKIKPFYKTKSVICAILVLLLCVALCACGEDEYKKIGKGENRFFIIFEKGDDKVSKYEIRTDNLTVGEALLENKLITFTKTKKGENYISVADGKKVNYDETNQFWAIYTNGKYLSSDPSNVAIADGDIYVMRIDTLVIPKIPSGSESGSADVDGNSSDSSADESATSSTDDASQSSTTAAESSSSEA